MKRGVSVVGVGMTSMARRDRTPEDMAREAVAEALADAALAPADLGLVIMANALGGRLANQGCIRGQSWLRGAGMGTAGVINVDNSCASGSSAMHLGTMAALAGQSPVLVVGVEKMWAGDRFETLAGIEDGLPADDRERLRPLAENEGGSLLMGLNATWVRHQIADRGTTLEQIAAAVVKARAHGALNPLAQVRKPVTVEEVLAAPKVVDPLTRLMCSSFTDGAAAVVLAGAPQAGSPRVVASVVRSGDGTMEYHDRLRETAKEAWKESAMGPGDIDIAEIHDATGAEELYALEALGFFATGEAGVATAAGHTTVGGSGLCVNPSGGLMARGHPLGATGLCQIVELTQQLRCQAGDRQHDRARTAMSVNTGGILSGQDVALVAMHILQRD